MQFYIDHPVVFAAREALPTHKPSPQAGGDYPFPDGVLPRTLVDPRCSGETT